MEQRKVIFKRIFGCVDWGYSNEMVCLVCGIDGDDRIYVIEEFYEKQTLMDEFIRICSAFKDKYGIEAFFCDPSEPEHITQFRRAGLNAQGGNNELLAGINKVATRLDVKKDGRARLYISSDCVNTLMEFENYRYSEVKEGKEVQEKPVKLFDHALDALRMLVMDLDSGDRFTILDSGEDVIF